MANNQLNSSKFSKTSSLSNQSNNSRSQNKLINFNERKSAIQLSEASQDLMKEFSNNPQNLLINSKGSKINSS